MYVHVCVCVGMQHIDMQDVWSHFFNCGNSKSLAYWLQIASFTASEYLSIGPCCLDTAFWLVFPLSIILGCRALKADKDF